MLCYVCIIAYTPCMYLKYMSFIPNLYRITETGPMSFGFFFNTHSLVTCTITRGHKLKHKPLSFSMFNAYYQSYICVLLNYGKARLISVLLKRYGGTNKTTFVQQNMPDELRYQGKTNFITSDVNKQVYISQIQRLIL